MDRSINDLVDVSQWHWPQTLFTLAYQVNSVSLIGFVIWQTSRIMDNFFSIIKLLQSSLVIKCSNLERKCPSWRCFMVDQIWCSKFQNVCDTSSELISRLVSYGHVIHHGDDSEYTPRDHHPLQWGLQTNFEGYWRLLQYDGIVDMSIRRNWQHGQLGSLITNINHAGLLLHTLSSTIYQKPSSNLSNFYLRLFSDTFWSDGTYVYLM